MTEQQQKAMAAAEKAIMGLRKALIDEYPSLGGMGGGSGMETRLQKDWERKYEQLCNNASHALALLRAAGDEREERYQNNTHLLYADIFQGFVEDVMVTRKELQWVRKMLYRIAERRGVNLPPQTGGA